MLTLSEETGIDRNADGRGTCRALRRRPGQGFYVETLGLSTVFLEEFCTESLTVSMS